MKYKKNVFSLMFLFFSVCALLYLYKKSLLFSPCLVIENARFFDSEAQIYVNAKQIVVHEHLIQNLVVNELPIETETCQHIDAKSKFIFPGLIDAHTHLFALDKQQVPSWRVALELSAARPTMMRLFMGEKNAKSMLKAGFTTLRDLGNSGFFLDEKLKDNLKQQGLFSPDIIYSGPALATFPSQINSGQYPLEYNIINTNTNLEKVFKTYREHGATWIKLYADNSDINQNIDLDLLKHISTTAKKFNFKIAVHSEFKTSAEKALLIEPNSIEHFYQAPVDYPASETNNTPYVVLTDYTLASCLNLKIYTDCEKEISLLKNRTNWLKSNNYKLVFGSDAVLDFSSSFSSRGEASLSSLTSLVELGLSPIEALTAATRTAGEMLQLPIGIIKNNYIADLVFYEEDPLLNIKNLSTRSMVIAKGIIICQSKNECRL